MSDSVIKVWIDNCEFWSELITHVTEFDTNFVGINN